VLSDDAVDGLGTAGTRRVLIGGGARSRAVQHIAPAVFGTPIEVAEPAEYVALGAAKQAAWALAGTPTPPSWPKVSTMQFVAEPTPEVRRKYSTLRDAQGAATSL
jgi:xylulokinase